MERRELLKIMALTLGGSIALPESVFAQLAEPLDPAKLKFFTPAQRELVAAVADTIIPQTDTPGAIEAGVPGWIELLVQDCLEPSSDIHLQRQRQPQLQQLMSDKSIEARVKDIIVDQLGVNADQVTTEAKFVEDLGADSLDTVELVMAFEEEFDIEVPDEEAEKLQAVGDVVNYITSQQA